MQSAHDPYAALGLTGTATPEEVRAAYLQLVREYPPDRDPQRFREIHAAYQALSNPLVRAEALWNACHERPDLQEALARADTARPRLRPLQLLALGNKEADQDA